MPNDSTGVAVADRYVVRRLLGRGRTSSVWEAEDRRLRRTVALKRVEHVGLPTDLALREASLTARVNHRSVVKIFDFVPDDGADWLVLEMLVGSTLQTIIQQRPLGHDAGRRMAAELGAALVNVHAAGLIHGDVTPSNLWVRTDGRFVLFDFGAAYEVGAHRTTGGVSRSVSLVGTNRPDISRLQTATPAHRGHRAGRHASDRESNVSSDLGALGTAVSQAIGAATRHVINAGSLQEKLVPLWTP
jgi:serine/threonine protein kinase